MKYAARYALRYAPGQPGQGAAPRRSSDGLRRLTRLHQVNARPACDVGQEKLTDLGRPLLANVMPGLEILIGRQPPGRGTGDVQVQGLGVGDTLRTRGTYFARTWPRT